MSKWDISFGVSDIGQEEQKTTSTFGGEAKPAKLSTSGLNATPMKKKPVMVTGGTAQDNDVDDPMGVIPTA